ncbi:MAG: helix-turn-helix transcriptional regulator [Tolumonas sp.]|nr:helix-turn-helix transcriptional regulator [Tolumonas sp.]
MDNSEFLKNFGTYIRTKRLEKGLSITEFANLAETDPAFVSRVERGLKDIKLTTVIRFLKVLELPLPYFL